MGCFGKEEERKMAHHGKGERERMEGLGGKQQGHKACFCPFMVMRNGGGGGGRLHLDQQWGAED